VSTLAVVLISGLATGAIYALVAEGLNLIWGVMRIVNLAHGEFLMIGAFVSYYLWQGLGWNPLLAILPAIVILGLLGLGIQVSIIRPIVGSPELISLLLTFGLSILITNLAVLALGAEFRSVDFLQRGLRVGDSAVGLNQIVIAIVAVAVSIGMFEVLRRSKMGLAIRAVAVDRSMAEQVGIDSRRILAFTFALGAVLAGVAGVLVSPLVPFNPLVGQIYILKAFAVVVLGGMGNFLGALFAGLMLGVVEAAVAYGVSVQLSDGVAFVVLILALFLRPEGLMGSRS
jgi:branched-chain amino acid transport system permease protein